MEVREVVRGLGREDVEGELSVCEVDAPDGCVTIKMRAGYKARSAWSITHQDSKKSRSSPYRSKKTAKIAIFSLRRDFARGLRLLLLR